MHNFIKVKTKTSLRGLKQARNKLIISTKQQKNGHSHRATKVAYFTINQEKYITKKIGLVY